MSYPVLSPDDAAWFEANPDRGYLCRHQTDAEKGEDRAALSGPAYGLAIIRRCDHAMVDMWSSNPGLYLRASDKSLAYWFNFERNRGLFRIEWALNGLVMEVEKAADDEAAEARARIRVKGEEAFAYNGRAALDHLRGIIVSASRDRAEARGALLDAAWAGLPVQP